MKSAPDEQQSLRAARDLIRARRYDEARALLRPLRHPTALEWLARLDLKQIAEKTNGLYYRSTNRPSLEKIFENIGQLEKTKTKVKTYTHYNERLISICSLYLAKYFIISPVFLRDKNNMFDRRAFYCG